MSVQRDSSPLNRLASLLSSTAGKTKTLDRNEQLLIPILECLPVAIFAKDIKNNFQWIIWNQCAEQIFGLKAKDCLGKTDHDIFPKEQADLIRKQDIEASNLQGVIDIPEERAIGPSGPLVLHTKKVIIRDSDDQPAILLGITENITEQVRTRENLVKAQQDLMQSSRLSALGMMAGGIAHEINNPLAIIKGKASALKKELLKAETSDPIRQTKLVEDIERTALRIATIVKGLKTLTRDGNKDPYEETTVRSIMNEVFALCRTSLFNHGVELKIPASFPDIPLQCRATQIGQVFLNLIHNSEYAIESLAEKWIEIKVEDTPNSVIFFITDSGKGIPEDIRTHMMEPFFTTKPVGKGTGLGLSISRGIIQSHQGKIFVDVHSPNTCFVVELPKRQPIDGVAPELKAA